MWSTSTILVIDDAPLGRATIEALLSGEGYTLVFAANGIEGMELAERLLPDVILLDVMMPGLDGYEVCRRLRAHPTLAEVPIVMVTALDGRDSRLEGLRSGADDFLSKPFDSLELQARLQTITRLNRYRKLNEERLRLERALVDLEQAYDTTLEGWVHALDLRDKETEGHSQRVTEMTVHLAQAMGLSEAQIMHIRRGALLHDIGKIGIPDSILLKPGGLTDTEWQIMRRHPLYAYEMLARISYLRPAIDIPYCHHEKWNGSGYPRALRGEEIPLAARLFSIVDVWDALRSDRPYRAAWPEPRVHEHLRAEAGNAFDPHILAIFLHLFSS